MKLYALIPKEYFKKAEECRLEFKMDATIGKNDWGEMTLILTVRDDEGKAVNGMQFISELENLPDAPN